MQKLLAALLLSFTAAGLQAQDVNPSVWTMAEGRFDLNKSWFYNNELHFRFTDGVSTFQQFLFRPQISYVLNPNFVFSVGYTYIHSYPYGEYPLPTDVGENNLWEEVMIHHKISALKVSHRIRMEHRWIQQVQPNDQGTGFEYDGYNFGHRFRYRLIAEYRWKKDSPWSIMVFDEVFFSTNEYALPQGINQNWLYVSARYKVSDRLVLQTGWQQQYLELSNGTTQHNPTWLTALHYHLPAKP